MSWQKYDVFGTSIACVTDRELAHCIEDWVGSESGHVVCFSDTHAIVKGHDDEHMREALKTADLVLPDGYPIAWLGWALYRLPTRRTCGPDFLDLLASRSPQTGLRHYLFGGKPGVADELRTVLAQRYPGVLIVGIDAPPMGPSSTAETEAQLERIIAARADVVWVGLGAPKQEIWMARHRHRLAGMTLCGVGAAFDFHTGRIKRAPPWMQRFGLEWAFRWMCEPRRLGPRYANTITRFVLLLAHQIWRMSWSSCFKVFAKTSPRRS